MLDPRQELVKKLRTELASRGLVHEDSATELEQVRLQAARQFFKE
jgi:hypothetical protein